jgi:NADH-quinone oxidoreductase subunit C
MSAKIIDILRERFGDAILSSHSQHGDDTVVVARERLLELLRHLRDAEELAFDMASDLTAIDLRDTDGWQEADPRFHVVYHLYSIRHKHRIRVKCGVMEDDAVVPSAVPIWSGLNWFEREVWDMYGVKFDGHPNLRRIFMYDEFVGHPLRKDYPKEKRQPLFRREGLT